MRQAGDGAGKDGSSHGERQHGVDHKHDEEEEGHLRTIKTGVKTKTIATIILAQKKVQSEVKEGGIIKVVAQHFFFLSFYSTKQRNKTGLLVTCCTVKDISWQHKMT